MATKAAQSNSIHGVISTKRWIQSHSEETCIALIGTALAFFFTYGLPLWDTGSANQPLHTFFYKLYFAIFGTGGSAWFFLKSIVFGSLCGSLWHWMKHMNLSRRAMAGALALFAFSASVVTSMVWHADWTVYSELILTLILFLSLGEIEKSPASRTIYGKGWKGMSNPFRRFLILFFFGVYLGSKIGGDVRLAPVILLTWTWLFRQEKFYIYWIPFSVTFAASLPWSDLPQILPHFDLARIWSTFGSDLLNLSWHHSPTSWMGAIGILVVGSSVCYLGYSVYCDKLRRPDEQWGFHLIWMGLALLYCSLFPVSGEVSSPQLLIALVPTTLLLGLVLHSAIRQRFPWMKHVTIAIVAVQVAFHLVHSFDTRRELGRRLVALDQIYLVVEKDYANSHFVYGPGLDQYGYKNTKVQAFTSARAVGSLDEVRNMLAGQTFVVSLQPTLDPRFTIERQATGCGGALFDLVARCDSSKGAFLLKFVGEVPELLQAYQFESQGNIGASRQLFEGYYQKDKGNHGVAFAIGLQSHRLGDFARMKQIFDLIGPFYPENVSVISNWDLAKQGANSQK